jgi:hypothetical protein
MEGLIEATKSEPRKEFQSYLFFLRHFCQLVGGTPASTDGRREVLTRLLDEQKDHLRSSTSIRPPTPVAFGLRKYLFTAWNAEALSRLSTIFEPEVRQFTNQWKPVQCYYAIYFQLVALQLRATGKISAHHAGTLKFATQSALDWLPAPWNLWFDYSSGGNNFPATTKFHAGPGWNLSNNDPHVHLANFYRRTAQRNQLEKWRSKLKKERLKEGPRRGKRYRVADVKTGRVSIFDVLWRFRCWANYQAADVIIEGADTLAYAAEFDESFNHIVDATSILCEAALCRFLGRDRMNALYQEYVGLVGATLDASQIRLRRELICGG